MSDLLQVAKGEEERATGGGPLAAKYKGSNPKLKGSKGEAYYNTFDAVWYYRTVEWINRNKKGEQKITGDWFRIPESIADTVLVFI